MPLVCICDRCGKSITPDDFIEWEEKHLLRFTNTINKEEGMKLGVSIFATDYAMRPDEFARACEERGFESVWYPEHTHIPASRRTPYPLGGDLPKDYWHIHDLFVALTAAAAAT